ncbi:MAG TPA: gluconate 2-dehydrogenase subunit 3 family protein [Candidatus Dormibacteraeota bacterium]|nr:gluconate 2-dehydrogenase subunit 3 family protein [Candidatus Dormibacteraeota bacterium]
MQRREALRLLATGTALQLAPQKLFAVLREARSLIQSQPSPRALKTHQYATVKTIAELILPRTETPGATDVGVADFVDLMLTEWYDEPERNRFLAGLADVDSRTKTLFGKDFLECSSVQQSEILIALGQQIAGEAGSSRSQRLNNAAASHGSHFYSMMRHLTLTAYYTSEAGATAELHFEIIPDRYQGCGTTPSGKEGLKQQ